MAEEVKLTKEDVRRLAKEFLGYVRYEAELQEQLLQLKLAGKLDEVREKLSLHDEIIREIERNRRENILPIIEKLMRFISQRGCRHV